MYLLRRTSLFGLLAALTVGGVLLAQPDAAAQGFADGVRLCLHSLLPSLFPFFVVCNLVTASPASAVLGSPLRPLLRLAGVQNKQGATVLLLGWLGGYAVCAQSLARARHAGTLTEREGVVLLWLGCCSGPGFVVGCVGGQLLGSVRLGVLLYFLQLAANLLAAAVLLPFIDHFVCRTQQTSEPQQSMGTTGLAAAINSAVDSSLCVCGCVLFFRIIGAVAAVLLPLSPTSGAFLSGIMEISSGCADFAALGGATALTGCCLCLSLLGLSVGVQLQALLGGCVPLKALWAARALHSVFFIVLVRLCARFMPGVQPVYSSLAARVVPMNRLPPDAAMLAFLFLCAALYKLRQNLYNSFTNSCKSTLKRH